MKNMEYEKKNKKINVEGITYKPLHIKCSSEYVNGITTHKALILCVF
jgi:hypothetical protein